MLRRGTRPVKQALQLVAVAGFVQRGGLDYCPAMTGTRITVRVTPKAQADRLDGWGADADGAPVLRLRVRAVPDKGRANKAVIALMARATGLPKSAVSIIAGATSRTKTVSLEAPPEEVSVRIAAALKGSRK